MVDWHYVDATRFLPNEAEALALRPKR